MFVYISVGVWQGHTRRLNIKRTACQGSDSNIQGVCMFNFECKQKKGKLIGTCVDGFLFGVCCDLGVNFENNPNLDTLEDVDKADQAVGTHPTWNNLPTEHSSQVPIIPIVSDVNKDNLLLTKTEPDNSVVLYAIDVFKGTNDPTGVNKITSTETKRPSSAGGGSQSMSAVLQVHESLYNDTNILKIPPISLDRIKDLANVKTSSELSTSSTASTSAASSTKTTQASPSSIKTSTAGSTATSISSTPSASISSVSQTVNLEQSKTTSENNFESSTEPLQFWTLFPQQNMNSRPSSQQTSESTSLGIGLPVMSDSSVSITAYMTVPKPKVPLTTPMTSNFTDPIKSETETSYLMESGETPLQTFQFVTSSLGTQGSSVTDSPFDTTFMNYFTSDMTFSQASSSESTSSSTTSKVTPKKPVLQPMVTQSSLFTETPELFFWTPTRPKLRPRPTTTEVPNFSSPSFSPELVHRTPPKPNLRPRPTTTESSLPQALEVIEKDKPSGFLVPNKPGDEGYFDTNKLVDSLMMSMSDTFHDETTDVNAPMTPTESWATSTYAILPVEFDISHNTIDVDTSNRKPSTQSSSIPYIGSSKPTQSAPTGIFSSIHQYSDFDPFDITTEPSVDFSTEIISDVTPSSADESSVVTTPIDEFIEHLLNSLMHSNASSTPPIDLDLIEQVF